jgi:hypothetical protein
MIFKNSWTMIFKNLRNYVFQFLYFFDKKLEKNTQLKKHLFFLFKVYYSPIEIHGP